MGEFDDLGRNKYEPGDFYWNEQGFRVFTEQFLLRRGYCCKNSCKHCPYGFNKSKKDKKDNT